MPKSQPPFSATFLKGGLVPKHTLVWYVPLILNLGISFNPVQDLCKITCLVLPQKTRSLFYAGHPLPDIGILKFSPPANALLPPDTPSCTCIEMLVLRHESPPSAQPSDIRAKDSLDAGNDYEGPPWFLALRIYLVPFL